MRSSFEDLETRKVSMHVRNIQNGSSNNSKNILFQFFASLKK
jgi:hypothetical protein